jgi:putative transposase
MQCEITWRFLQLCAHYPNHERFHQSLDYRTPADVYLAKRHEETEITTFYQPASILIT